MQALCHETGTLLGRRSLDTLLKYSRQVKVRGHRQDRKGNVNENARLMERRYRPQVLCALSLPWVFKHILLEIWSTSGLSRAKGTLRERKTYEKVSYWPSDAEDVLERLQKF
ncbi:hypothetical protein ACROYT_G020638 [Oculina patagonica]